MPPLDCKSSEHYISSLSAVRDSGACAPRHPRKANREGQVARGKSRAATVLANSGCARRLGRDSAHFRPWRACSPAPPSDTSLHHAVGPPRAGASPPNLPPRRCVARHVSIRRRTLQSGRCTADSRDSDGFSARRRRHRPCHLQVARPPRGRRSAPAQPPTATRAREVRNEKARIASGQGNGRRPGTCRGRSPGTDHCGHSHPGAGLRHDVLFVRLRQLAAHVCGHLLRGRAGQILSGVVMTGGGCLDGSDRTPTHRHRTNNLFSSKGAFS